MLAHLEVERPLQQERTMTMLLNAKLRELVDVIVEKPAGSDAEAGRSPSASTALARKYSLCLPQ